MLNESLFFAFKSKSCFRGYVPKTGKIISKILMKISSEENMEPTAKGYDSTLITYDLGVETTHEFLIQLEKEFNEMIESVEKYGGFYIGCRAMLYIK